MATELLAIGLFAAMGAILAALVARLFRRSPFTPLQSLLFAVNYLLVRLWWRARASGPLPLAPNEGGVIVCNHRSPADPLFLYLTTLRVVHWMVAREYTVHPAGAWFFRACQTIPVNRGGIDTGSTKAAIRQVENGGLVGLFPEGRINTTERVLLPGRPGAAMIALKARAPVVPCYVKGSPYRGSILGCLLIPAKVEVVVGPRIDLSDYFDRGTDRAVLQELTRRFLREIAELAGCPHHEPELAGRFYKPSENDE
jgi:1-acyl-sn-glycerol-3-phosphate acyltransferase